MGCGSTKQKHVEDPKKVSAVPEKATASAGGNRGLNLLKELQEKDGKDTKGIAALLSAAGGGETPAVASPAPAPAPAPTQAPAEKPAAAPAAAPKETAAFDLKTRAKIAQRGPYPVEVEAGKSYYWCVCGHSKTQPFCDGSHIAINEKEGTTFTPVEYKATESKTVYFCGCKHTSTAPLCDGSHSKLPAEEKAAEAAPSGSTGLRSVDILKELADEQEGKREYKGIQLLHEVLSAQAQAEPAA